jgi:hypothetical protein
MNVDSTTIAGRLSERSEPASVDARQTKNLTIYWLIDESGSMRMDRMSIALQTALAQGFQDLARQRPSYPEVDLFTRTRAPRADARDERAIGGE